MHGQLLQTLDPLVVREDLLDLVVFKVLHLDLPEVILDMVVVEARTGVLGTLKLVHPL